MIAMAEGRIWRVWYQNGFQEMLGFGEGELRSAGEDTFAYENQNGHSIYKFAYHGGEIVC